MSFFIRIIPQSSTLQADSRVTLKFSLQGGMSCCSYTTLHYTAMEGSDLQNVSTFNFLNFMSTLVSLYLSRVLRDKKQNYAEKNGVS